MEKTRSIILYILIFTEYKELIFLNCILYLIEANYYELYEEKLTGGEFLCFMDLPKFINLKAHLNQIKKDEKNLTLLLNDEELEVIKQVIKKVDKLGKTKFIEYIKYDMPLLCTVEYKLINLEFVFYRNPEYEVRKYAICYDCKHQYYKRIEKENTGIYESYCKLNNIKIDEKCYKCENFINEDEEIERIKTNKEIVE